MNRRSPRSPLLYPDHPRPGPASIHTRSFQNGDPPRLAALWNRSLPAEGVVRPLTGHEFDAAIVGRLDFDRLGLIVAEADGHLVGFAHAGFGPSDPDGPSHRLDPLLGTVAMLVVDPAVDALDVGSTLLRAAERYLRDRGARVIYAGGRAPLDPFYRSTYGASEWAGILDRHTDFVRVVEAEGYAVVARSTALEVDLAEPEIRDPKAAIHRRQTRLEVTNDPTPTGWWDALALGHATTTRFVLASKADGTELARATTWDMAAFGRLDGRARVGLRDVEVVPERRRQGYGRYLVGEILRHARGEWADVLAVATDQENLAARGLYESVGFRAISSAALYRKPGL